MISESGFDDKVDEVRRDGSLRQAPLFLVPLQRPGNEALATSQRQNRGLGPRVATAIAIQNGSLRAYQSYAASASFLGLALLFGDPFAA